MNKEYLTLYPSYWLYNAGLVGIIRTIETAIKGGTDKQLKEMKKILDGSNIRDNKYYEFGDNGELYIHKKVWDILPDLYVNMMSWILNKWWFSSIIQKGGIFPGNYIFNAFDSKITKAYEIYEFLIKENEQYLQNICDSDISALTNLLTNIQKQDKKNYKIIKEINYNIILKSIIRTLFMNKNKKNIFNELYTCLKNYKKGDDTGKWESILKYNDNVSAIKIILIEVLRHIFYELKDSKSLEYQCSLCGHIHKPWKYEEFNTIWFSKEGGSPNKFENALWYGKTGINMCNRCQWILFFVYIGLNGNIKNNQFINISSAKQLWILNDYIYKLRAKQKEKKENKKNNNLESRLINAITSTGALLKIRSRWMLQNVEFIEIGGARDKTVYNLDIAPVPLKLLTDYTSGLIPVWLSKVEKIYAPDIYGKIYGISLIKNFLKNETDRMLNKAILIFKYIIKEKKKGMDKLKSLLLLIISLIDKQQAEDIFYYFGNRLRYSLKANNKDSDIYIFTLFSKIVTNRKQEFLDEVFRIYMQVSEEIPSKFVSMLNMEKTKFKTNGLLFLSGLKGGADNE